MAKTNLLSALLQFAFSNPFMRAEELEPKRTPEPEWRDALAELHFA
jgi:hypothetical protein